MVYIDEAHPSDDINRSLPENYYQIPAHKSIGDRIMAAKYLEEATSGLVLVDTINNEAGEWYGAFPAKLIIILESKIVFVHTISKGFKPDLALEWLSDFIKNKRQL